MVMRHNRLTVADIQSMKARGQKISMLYVTTLEEAAAADAADVTMLSIEGGFFSPEMREAAGRCFVQVGLPYAHDPAITKHLAAFLGRHGNLQPTCILFNGGVMRSALLRSKIAGVEAASATWRPSLHAYTLRGVTKGKRLPVRPSTMPSRS